MKKLKNLAEELNLNYKRELILILFVLLIIFLVTIIALIFRQLLLSLLSIFGMVLFIVYLFYRYSNLKTKQLNQREDEFVHIIQYLEIFLSNHMNMYNAFLQVQKYCSPWMREQVEQFLFEVDQDKSVSPYVNFAKKFLSPIAENIMISLFQMVEEGENHNQLNQFDLLFQRFAENHQDNQIANKTRQMDNLSIYPLIGAAIITILLTFGILVIMEEVINVI